MRGCGGAPRRAAAEALLSLLLLLPALAAGGGALSGRLAFLTCDYPACDSVELRALDLATNASDLLWALPGGALDDAYGGNCLLADARTLLLGLQFDAAPGQGALVTFDLVARAPRGAALNTTSCVVLLLDPSDARGARLLCLAIVEGGPDGEATQLRHIDRLTGEDKLVAQLFPQHSTFGEAVLSRGVLFVPMAPLAAGPFFIAAIDPQTGDVLATNGEAPGGQQRVALARAGVPRRVAHHVFPVPTLRQQRSPIHSRWWASSRTRRPAVMMARHSRSCARRTGTVATCAASWRASTSRPQRRLRSELL